MATKRIETQLTIRAVDEYTGMLRNMRVATGRFADGVRTELSGLQKQRGALQLIEDFKAAQAQADRARVAFERQKAEVRRLREEMRSAERPTDAMARAFEAAKAKAERLRMAHRRQLESLRGLNVKMRETGINTADLGAEQRRLEATMDGATAAVGRQMDRLRRLDIMHGRIADARKKRDDSLGVAANLSFVGSAATDTGRRILTPLSGVANRSGDLQEQFTDFQSLTGIDDTRLAKLRDDLDGLRDVTKTSVSEMLDGLAVMVGKGMDFEDALAALPAAGRAAKATKTSIDEMGASGFALYDNLKVAPEELGKAFDVMAMGGKEGGFELNAMARKFPEITAGARALKMEGLDSVAQLTAALQISMKSAGSEDQAATNLSNFLGKLTSPETIRNFRKFGVSVEKELALAAENGVSPFEHMLGVINDLTGGDAIKMGQLFGDKQVLDFLRAMIPNLEEYRRIKTKALSADGVIDADFERALSTYNAAKAQLGESVGKLFSLPPEVLESLTDLFQTADAIVERMIVWKKENPKLVKGLFLGATALGAMAVTGGALLTAAAGLVGTMAVLRFGLVGLGARAAFAAGDLVGVAEAVKGVNRLKINPSVPDLSRHRGAFVDFRRSASGQIEGLSADVATGAANINRSLSRIKWSSFFASIMMFNAVSNIPEDPEERKKWQERNVRSMDSLFRKTPGFGHLIEGYEWAFEKWHGAPPPSIDEQFSDGSGYGPKRRAISPRVKTPLAPMRSMLPVARGDHQTEADYRLIRDASTRPLPSENRLDALRELAGGLKDEIAALDAQIANLGTGPGADAMATPLRQTADARRRELAEVEAELAQAEQAATDLEVALQRVLGTEGAISIDTSSVDAALAKLERIRTLLDRVSGTNVAANAVAPKPAGARAGGGPVRAGLPYLVNENTPRSEWFFPSVSGGILNVSQMQAAVRTHLSGFASRPLAGNPELARLHRGAQGLRAASLAVLTGSVLAAPAAAQPAQAAKPGSGAVTVQIENFTVHVPAGVSDPEAIADLVSDRIGQRVAATMVASFSD